MPWCPVCKCEYREGVTNCYDCRVPLVESLDDINEDTEDKNSEQPLFDEFNEFGEKPEIENINPDTEDPENILSEESLVTSGSFVKKSDQYQEYLFSAYTCIIVGVIGIVFCIVNISGILSFVSASFTQYILLAVFVLFFIGGIAMFNKSRSIKSQIGSEDQAIEAINKWLSENIDLNTLESMKDAEVSDEINYFNYCEKVKERLFFNMPDIDPAMADSLIDEYINGIMN